MAKKPKQPSTYDKLLIALDALQQQHNFLAFPYAVAKKYNDDQGRYLAAIIAYYGFVSLFPLLIVGMAIMQIVARDNPELQNEFLKHATSYFPAIGSTLADSIRTPSKSGLALVIGLLITLYGAKGVTAAAQHALNHIWAVPKTKRLVFPRSLLRSLWLVCFGGMGFVAAAVVTGEATAHGHGWLYRSLLGLFGFLVLLGVFWVLYIFGSSARKHPRAYLPGAISAAVGLTLLHIVGGYVMSHELRAQTGLTAQFAVVLAILFWIYLQALVFVYSAEISSVRFNKLWPRSLVSESPSRADLSAYELYRRRETYIDTASKPPLRT